MVVACVGVLNDKNGTNQTRMHKWMEAKLVRACVARDFVQELDSLVEGGHCSLHERVGDGMQVEQGDTERLPPNFKKHLHEVLEKLVTEQTLVRDTAHPTLFKVRRCPNSPPSQQQFIHACLHAGEAETRGLRVCDSCRSLWREGCRSS